MRHALCRAMESLTYRAFGRSPAPVQPTDCFICSWPRSGNTWMRFLLAYVLHQDHDQITGEMINAVMPGIDRGDLPALLSRPIDQRPRFFKLHEPCIPYLTQGRVVYIVRDGRDAALSYYDYKHKTSKPRYHGMTFSQFLRLMVKGRVGYGSWRDNVRGWWELRDHPHVLIIRYEDMLADTKAQLRRVLAHFHIQADDAIVRRAIDRSTLGTVYRSFANYTTTESQPFAGGLGGGSGRWRAVFSAEDLALFLRHNGRLMEELGYDTAVEALPPAMSETRSAAG